MIHQPNKTSLYAFRLFSYLTVMIFLTSCDDSPSYEHPAKGIQSFYADTKECENESERVYPNTGGLIGIGKKNIFIEECLQKKGWIKKQT